MPDVDVTVLAQPQRLAAARRARRLLPGLAMPLDAIARLAARLTRSPMAIVAVMDVVEEHFVGSHGLPAPLATGDPVPVEYSVCKFVVTADHPVTCGDMTTDADLRGHALAVQHGARAFAGVPLRDAADHTVGSLLVVDVVPRSWTDEDAALLVEISALLAGLPAGGVYTDGDAVSGLDAAALLDTVQQAFIAIDATGIIVGWNPAAQTMLGWAAAEAQGHPVDELLLPAAEREGYRRALPDLMASTGPQAWAGRMPVCHRDGHELAAHVVVSILRGRRGPLACVFLTDLAGQAGAERDANAQRVRMTALLNSLATPVAALDARGRLTAINQAMCELHALPAEGLAEAFASAMSTHLHHLDGTPFAPQQAPLLRAFRGENVRDQEMLVLVPGEPARIVLANAAPVAAPAAGWAAVMACHDITERHRIERFRACQLAIATDLAHTGDIHRSATAITDAVAAALGWPHVELWLHDALTDTVHLAAYHSTLGAQIAEFVTRPVAKGVGVSGTVWATAVPLWIPEVADTTRLTSPESERSVRMCSSAGLHTMLSVPIPAGDQVLGVLTCFAGSLEHDQTSLTTLLAGIGEQLGQLISSRRSEQLTQEVARGKDDFLALVGHEMRTPLTVISSYIDMLLDDSDFLTGSDDTRRLHEGIARSTATLRATIDNLLDLTGLESGHLKLSSRPIDLAAIARQAVRDIQDAAAANGVTVAAEVPEQLLTTGDPQRLRQVLGNLLSNAVKYSPDGGHTTLTLAHDDHVCTITVADNGIGIPPQERHHLFHRFYRAANARHTAIPGTGLGLSIVRTIVEAHHGTVTLDDTPTTGTTITVRLPHASPTA